MAEPGGRLADASQGAYGRAPGRAEARFLGENFPILSAIPGCGRERYGFFVDFRLGAI